MPNSRAHGCEATSPSLRLSMEQAILTAVSKCLPHLVSDQQQEPTEHRITR